MTIGAAGYGFTREEAQKVQKTSSLKIQAVYLECESEEANPLLEDAVLEVNRAVEEHFAKMQEETGYVEAYHNLHVYTKKRKRCGYICDICDIRYENPRDLYRSTRTCNILCKKRKGQDAGNLRSKRE